MSTSGLGVGAGARTELLVCQIKAQGRVEIEFNVELTLEALLELNHPPPNFMGRRQWSLTRSITQEILATTVEIRLEDGHMYQQSHAPDELSRFIRVLARTENDEAVFG